MMKSEKINAYVATLAVWNVKLHNIHWNVEGHLFKGIHEYTESLYDRAAEQYDETAVILKMRGEMPVASIAESLKASVIEELPSRVFSCCEAVAVVQADMEKV
ncbi:MAG: DNA starvation/stationary phase protection protein, partial [Sutterella sp.]|nr:DNA starvation/stationary phase protection protein [Sutterella sp.]